MLRKLRIVLQVVMMTLATLLLLGIGFQVHLWAGWVAKIQFLPAFLAFNAVVVTAIILVTIFFGRIYCSVVCPLGIMQDIFSWIGGKVNKNRFNYAKENKWLRYTKKTITISFDDGFANNLNVALPILEKYDIPVTFFVSGIHL